MKVTQTSLKSVLVIEPQVFNDPRGFFLETYNRQRYVDNGIVSEFFQDNMSSSLKGTLRGLHYQYPNSQAKLVQVIQGAVFDVAVDIRRGSPDFGKWVGVELSSENRRQLYIPEGFAHGFCVLSKTLFFIINAVIFIRRKMKRVYFGVIPSWVLTGLLMVPYCLQKTALITR